MDVKPALATSKSTKTSVFEKGNLLVKELPGRKPLYIVTPTEPGNYPVFLFIHGFPISNIAYSQLLKHIASHGFIAVAPDDDEIFFRKGLDWLAEGLSKLPDKVIANTSKLAVGGHSKGGKIAFALALTSTSLKFSAVFGVDPVAGTSPSNRPKPHILTYIPHSFNQQIPVAIIGTGLGSLPKGMIPPFSPEGVNHAEFFNESKPPVYYFLAKDYGHGDMLDEGSLEYWFAKRVTRHGEDSKLMIKGCGGIIVAFLKAKLKGEDDDLKVIGNQPDVAPIKLDPVIYEKNC